MKSSKLSNPVYFAELIKLFQYSFTSFDIAFRRKLSDTINNFYNNAD